MSPPPDTLLAMEANLVTHLGWLHEHHPEMLVDHRLDLIVVDSGLPCDSFNQVCRARLTGDGAAARIAETIGYFEEVARPFSWWLGPMDQPADLGRLLGVAGLVPGESEEAMSLDLSGLRADPTQTTEFRVEQIQTIDQLRRFAEVNASNWSPPDPYVRQFYEMVADLVLSTACPLHFYLGFLGEVAVATSEACYAGGAVGLYNISTLAAYRGRGFGSAVVRQPLLDAQAAGVDLAVLQASAAGARVYAKLGFATVGRYTEFQVGR